MRGDWEQLELVAAKSTTDLTGWTEFAVAQMKKLHDKVNNGTDRVIVREGVIRKIYVNGYLFEAGKESCCGLVEENRQLVKSM